MISNARKIDETRDQHLEIVISFSRSMPIVCNWRHLVSLSVRYMIRGTMRISADHLSSPRTQKSGSRDGNSLVSREILSASICKELIATTQTYVNTNYIGLNRCQLIFRQKGPLPFLPSLPIPPIQVHTNNICPLKVTTRRPPARWNWGPIQ